MKAQRMITYMRATLVIGTMCLALVPSTGLPSKVAMAATCATNDTFIGTGGGTTPMGAASGSITAQAPNFPCSTSQSTSFWVMVTGPGSSYAQGGWLIGDGQPQCTASSPCVWSEYSSASCNTCFYPHFYGAPGGTHMYETDILNTPQRGTGWQEDFYKDGSLVDAFSVDWNGFGNGVQYAQENHSDDIHWGPDTFSTLRYCYVPSGNHTCTPTSSFPVPSSSNLGPSNGYHCYVRTATDAFKDYDTRDYNNHC